MRPDKGGVCLHGGLRRQCESCDLADRLEAAEGRLLRISGLVNGFHNGPAQMKTKAHAMTVLSDIANALGPPMEGQ